jgi:hypothetical protein
MDSALTQVFAPGGGNGGGGIGAAVAAPINALSNASQASAHLSLLGVLAFLIVLWVMVRIAGFRFGVQVSSGVGR